MKRNEFGRLRFPVHVYPRSRILGSIIVLLLCICADAQSAQFLPEIDTYLEVNSDVRLWFEAKGTREGRTPVQSEIGPSIDLYIKSLPKLIDLAKLESDNSESRLLILSVGYRYLAAAGNAPGTNRIEPVTTLQGAIQGGFRVWDRNRFDLDWQNGGYTWRYRNRFQLERGFTFGHHRITPYASAEVYYQSRYQKWSETDLYAGLRLPLGKVVALNAYYDHENNTGKAPNQQVNALGLALNLYFSAH